MNNLKVTLVAALGLLLTSFTSAQADGGDAHGGLYAGVNTAVVGFTATGDHTSANDKSTGAIGEYANIGGFEFGWAWMGDTFGLDFGANYVMGEAKISSLSTASGQASNKTTAISLEASDMTTYFIAPTWAVSDTSSLYVKFGKTDVDLTVVGDVNKPTSLDGDNYAFGSTTQFASGLYIKTEAGFTEYDKITLTGLGTSDGIGGTIIPTTTSIRAEPTVAYGQVSLGYKF